MARTTKKLRVRRETLHRLTGGEMSQAAGGRGGGPPAEDDLVASRCINGQWFPCQKK